MSVPDPPPDLGPVALVRHCIEQWRGNALCRRVWRRIRLLAIACALVRLAVWALMFLVPLLAGGRPRPSWRFLGFQIVPLATFLLLAVALPVVHARWAVRKCWTEDPAIRSMPEAHRVLVPAVVLPAVIFALAVMLPTDVAGAVLDVVLAAASVHSPDVSQIVLEHTFRLSLTGTVALLVATATLRSMVASWSCSDPQSRGLASFLIPYGGMAVWMAICFIVGGVFVALESASRMEPSGLDLVCLGVPFLVGGFVVVPCMRLRKFWDADIALAEEMFR